MRTLRDSEIGSNQSQIVSVRSRPLRLGFVVNRNIDKQTLHDVFQYNASVWGGSLNVFVPTDGETIREDWWQILYYYDPDLVIYVGAIQQRLVVQIYEKLQPFDFIKWDLQQLEQLVEDRNFNSISTWALLRHYFHTVGPIEPDRSFYCYPDIMDSHYADYYQLTYGTYPDPGLIRRGESLENSFEKILGARKIVCSPKNLSEHLALTEDFYGKMTPLQLTRFSLKSLYHGPFSNFYLPSIIVSDGHIDDLFLSHLVQWPAPMSEQGRRLAWVHIKDCQTPQDLSTLADWVTTHVGGQILNMASLSIDAEQLRGIRHQLRLLLPERIKQVNITWGNIIPDIPDIFHIEKQQLATITNRGISVTNSELKIDSSDVSGANRWITEVDLSRYASRKGFIPSMFPDLNYVLSEWKDKASFHARRIRGARISRGLMAIVTNFDNQVVDLFLPSTELLFRTALDNAGYQLTIHENKGRFVQSMVQMVGDLDQMRFLRNEYMLNLFSSFRPRNSAKTAKKTSGVTFNNMKEIAKPGKDDEQQLREEVERLSGKQVFLRGYTLRCFHCDLETWYDVDEVAEWVICKGCKRTFQMPFEGVDFSYQLNQLFFEGIAQGGLTVLLTTLLLHDFSEKSMMWQASYAIQKKPEQQVDIDLLAMCDGYLVVAECKDNFAAEDEDQLEKLFTQIRRDVNVAKDVGANIFLFATLRSDIPEKVSSLLEELDREHATLTVRLIRRDDLMRGYLIDETNNQNSPRSFWPIGRLAKPLPVYPEQCFEQDPYYKDQGPLITI